MREVPRYFERDTVIPSGSAVLRYGFSRTQQPGWYLMRQRGCRVRIIGPFPTEANAEAAATSAERLY